MADLLCYRSFFSCKDNTLNVWMDGHHTQQRTDQLGKVANPARGQLNRGKCIFPCPRSTRLRFWPRETSSAVPSRVSLLILHTQAESGAYLRDSSGFTRRRPFTYLKPSYAVGSVPSSSGHAIVYRWPWYLFVTTYIPDWQPRMYITRYG